MWPEEMHRQLNRISQLYVTQIPFVKRSYRTKNILSCNECFTIGVIDHPTAIDSIGKSKRYAMVNNFVENEWAASASMSEAINVSDNGLSTVHQTIIWNNDGLLLIAHMRRNWLQWYWNKDTTIFIQDKAFINVYCKRPCCLGLNEPVNRTMLVTC